MRGVLQAIRNLIAGLCKTVDKNFLQTIAKKNKNPQKWLKPCFSSAGTGGPLNPESLPMRSHGRAHISGAQVLCVGGASSGRSQKRPHGAVGPFVSCGMRWTPRGIERRFQEWLHKR